MTGLFTGAAFQRESPPSRGAWIEIFLDEIPYTRKKVAPLAGGVD